MPSVSPPTPPLFSLSPPPDLPCPLRPSGSKLDVSQVNCSSGSLETSKGKLLICQNSRNLCLEVADAIVDSLCLLVELSVAKELGLESPVESGVGGCVDGVEGR